MDKFGIFKLLNSFFDFYNKNSDKTSSPLSSLFKSATVPTEKENSPPRSENKSPNRTANAPLQQQMLSTMRSHDEVVKRVNSSIKKR